MEQNTLHKENILGEFFLHPTKPGFAIIDCSFSKEVAVEYFIQDTKGRIRKKMNFRADVNTKKLEIDLGGLSSDRFQVWFFVEDQTFIRDLKCIGDNKVQNDSKLERFFRFFS